MLRCKKLSRLAHLRLSEVCILLAMVFTIQCPSNGWAEESSPIWILREASIYAARISDDYSRQIAVDEVIRAQEKAGDDVGAMKTAELGTLPRNRDNAWGATVVAIQAKHGNVLGATQTLALITEKISRANAIASIAVAYAAAGDIPKALELAGEIPDTSHAYADAFLRIAAVQAKAGDVPGTLRTIAKKWRSNPYGVFPIVEAQLAVGSIDRVIHSTNLISDPSLKSYMLFALVNQVTHRDRQIEIAAIIPVEGVRALAYKSIAEGQFGEGDVQGCLRSLKVSRAAVPAVYNNFARADLQWRISAIFAKAQDIDQAREVAMTIEMEGHRNAALRDIIDIQATAQDYDGALQTAFLGTGEDSPADYALRRIAERQVVEESLEKATSTVAKIKRDEARREALSSLAVIAGKAGQIAMALKLIGLQRERAAEALKLFEMPGAAEQLKRDAKRFRKLSFDVYLFQTTMSWTLREIALSRAGSDALQEAFGYALMIPDGHEGVRTINRIAFNQAKNGDVDGALRWSRRAQLPSHTAFALAGIASALLLGEQK